MRALQIAACGLGLLAWSLGIWFHVLPVPMEIAVRTVVPAPPARRALAAHTVQVAAQPGAAVLALPLQVPAGVWEVRAQVAQPFGSTRGLETLAVGDRVHLERFGRCTGRTCTTGGLVLGPRAVTLLLVSLGGVFDHEGLLDLTLVPAGPAVYDAAAARERHQFPGSR